MWRVLRACVAVLCLGGCSGDALDLADGSYTRLDEWKGRWVVINYWAEWCAPCREEIPEFNRLYSESGAGGPLVIGVNYDGLKPVDLNGVIERMDVRFPTLVVDPQALLGYERPSTLPTTIVIGPDAMVVRVLRGPQTLHSIRSVIDAHSP